VRIRRIAGLVAMFAAAAGCGPGQAAGPSPSLETGSATSTLCPVGDPPPADVSAAAVAVIERRLAGLEIRDASVTLGDCIDIVIPGGPGDDRLRAVLFGTGLADLRAVPPDRVDEVVPGRPPPDDLTLVFDSAGITGATASVEAVDLALDPAASTILATWTTTHAGERLALVLDGSVVGSLPIEGRIVGDQLRVPIDAGAGLDAVAVAALLAGGPLPGDWRQPEAPQG
jgi:preprotein translocase subunit SecD